MAAVGGLLRRTNHSTHTIGNSLSWRVPLLFRLGSTKPATVTHACSTSGSLAYLLLKRLARFEVGRLSFGSLGLSLFTTLVAFGFPCGMSGS
jgi:hypothetical protein